MATVYSVQLAAQANYIGTLIVLVPVGFKLVLRDIDAWHNASGGAAQLLLQGNITHQTLAGREWSSSDSSAWQWTGRQVFEAGQEFLLVATDAGGNGISFQASGYKLVLP